MRFISIKDAINPRHRASRVAGYRPLLRQIEINQHHLKVIRSVLSEEAAEHCTYVRYTPERITLLVDSSVWANLLRLDSNRILAELRELPDYVACESIRIQVNRS